MFPFPIAKPQGCDIQTFYGCNGVLTTMAWNKPVGVSNVYIMLIGAGGNGNGTSGGGSGGVTVWYGAAQHIPDSLIVVPAPGAGSGTGSLVYYRLLTTPQLLLTANSASSVTGAAAVTATAFAASGFYKSTAGQDGSTGNISPSGTTFLCGGGGASNRTITANYGYVSTATTNLAGTFLMQPIIVGLGGKATSTGGVGCGGGVNGIGGSGMILIASW
jgi:hypothetical protein